MTDATFKSAVELAELIRDRQIGCLELLDDYLDRVDQYNPQIKAIAVQDAKRARERARQADAALAGGEVWGPLHGGANVAVVNMLETIRDENTSVGDYVAQVKDKKAGIRLMGFGHRVYKNFDPRAKIIKKSCEKVLAKLHINDPLLDIAKELEAVALEDEYFIQRKLYPNVDFYSGVILRALGIPKEMFTVIFAIGRMPGWIAHWYEESKATKISRPRQIYTGSVQRTYQPLAERP